MAKSDSVAVGEMDTIASGTSGAASVVVVDPSVATAGSWLSSPHAASGESASSSTHHSSLDFFTAPPVGRVRDSSQQKCCRMTNCPCLEDWFVDRAGT